MPKRNKSYWMMLLAACTVVSAVLPLSAAARGGNSIASAPEISLGVQVTGSLDGHDYWRLTASKGDKVRIDFGSLDGDRIQVCFMRPEITDYSLSKAQCWEQDNSGDSTFTKGQTIKTLDASGRWTVIVADYSCINNYGISLPCYEEVQYEMTVYVSGPPAPTPPPTKPLPEPLPATGPALVAVGGDSYAAGLGTQRFPVYGNGCHRTDQGWPNLMPLPVVSVACSGAHISALYDSFQGQSPQIAHIKRVKPDAVVMMIGGNDAGFSTALYNCLRYNCAGGKLNQNGVKIVGMHGRLAPGYAAIARGLPEAKVFVPLYPLIFPAYPAQIVNCGWLSNSERLMLNRMAIALNTEIKLAVAQANASIGGQRRVYLVSGTQSAFDGHELCSGGNSWVFKLTPACLKDLRCGHPTAPGQEALAEVIASAINSKY